MAEKFQTKKLSDFPEAKSIDDLFTLGTDKDNNSVKVPIELLRGNSPYIGVNGNWWVGTVDTGQQAQGTPGEVSKVELEAKADFANKKGESVIYAEQVQEGIVTVKDVYDNLLIKISPKGNIKLLSLDLIEGLIDYIKKHANAQIQETNDGRFVIGDIKGNEVISIESDGKIKVSFDRIDGLSDHILKFVSTSQTMPDFDTMVTVFKPGDFGSLGFRIPFCTITKKGTILVGCEARYDGTGADHQKEDVVLKRSTDRGLTFDSGQIVHKNNNIVSNSRKQNSVICIDEITGRIYLFAHSIDNIEGWEQIVTPNWYLTNADMVYKYSDNDGISWSEEISFKTSYPSLFPENCVSLFPTTGQGITMIDGTIIIPCQCKQPNLYTGTETDSSKNFNIQACFLYLTPENKKTQKWQRSSLVPTYSSENMIAEYEEGKLMINCRGYMGKRRVFVTSDMGATWQADSSDKTLLDPTQHGGCQATLFKARFGDDLFRKSYGLFLNPNDASNRINMTLQASADFHTWHPVTILYDQYTFGYSCLAQRNDLLIAVLEKATNNIDLFILDSTKKLITKTIWD